MSEINGKQSVITIFDGNEQPRTIDLRSFGKDTITMGRALDNDIVLKSLLVSKYHAKFVFTKEGCSVYDLQSTNGLLVEGKKVGGALLLQGNVMKITNAEDNMSFNVSIVYGSEGENTVWKNYNIQNKMAITIGRDPKCHISWSNSSVSKEHARITYGQTGYILTDTSSSGVIVNGQPVHKCCQLKEKDVILIGNAKLIFTSAYISYVIYDSGVQVEAKDVVKTVHGPKGKLNIVNHINLTVAPGEFVAIIGGSGAGKSSFMNCISGYSKPTNGQVLVNGDDLYENYETLKQIIGYVPQADIVYDNLTVQGMLNYAAMLRMPKDTTRKERKAKVTEVIGTVELQGKEKSMIKSLSGGQRKRVSIAVELLSDPTLFFLDEPSSGLDPGTEQNLMRTLYKMSRMGKTIILITHNTMNINLCDKVIFLGKGGNLCYYGAPDEAYDFFGVDQLVNVYNMVTENSEEWKQKYSTYAGKNWVESSKENPNANPKVTHKGAVMKQTGILTKRYFSLMLHDVKRLMMLIFQAPLLGVLMYLVADSNVFEQYEITKAILFAVSCCAFWIGILNSIQEVCKERTILKREYLSGLSPAAYILSKFIVLGFWCMIQSALLIGTVGILIGLPSEGIFLPVEAEFFITTFLTAFSATAMGLFVSSLFHNADRAMTVAPILLMPQILFSGLAFTLSGFIDKVSYIVTCRWAMEAYGSIADLNNLTLRIQETIPEITHETEDFYAHSMWHLVFSWEILLGFIVIFGLLCYLALANIEKS